MATRSARDSESRENAKSVFSSGDPVQPWTHQSRLLALKHRWIRESGLGIR